MPDPTPLDDLFHPGDDRPTPEDLDDGAGHLLDLIAAVDFLRRGDRHGLTVWDALEEAIRWWNAETDSTINGITINDLDDPGLVEVPWEDPDPLRSAIDVLIWLADHAGVDTPVALQQAVRRWTTTMAGRHNDDQPWPPPRAGHRSGPAAGEGGG